MSEPVEAVEARLSEAIARLREGTRELGESVGRLRADIESRIGRDVPESVRQSALKRQSEQPTDP